MDPLQRQIQDTAARVARLSAYCDRSASLPPAAVKSSGDVFLCLPGRPIVRCRPRTAEAWEWWAQESITKEQAIELLLKLERQLTDLAMAKARHDAIEELAARKVSRVTRPKTRGFKADQKRAKAKSSRSRSGPNQ